MLLETENPEVQELEDESEVFKDNQFIYTCDKNGIANFERLLGIQAMASETLDFRIARVLARWNDTVPYTFRVLIAKLNALCGEGNYILTTNFNEYELSIEVTLKEKGQVAELEYLIGYMLPANLLVTLRNELTLEAQGLMSLASATTKNRHRIVPPILDFSYKVYGLVSHAHSATTVTHHVIQSTLDFAYTADGLVTHAHSASVTQDHSVNSNLVVDISAKTKLGQQGATGTVLHYNIE